jgi:hypothetical protein
VSVPSVFTRVPELSEPEEPIVTAELPPVVGVSVFNCTVYISAAAPVISIGKIICTTEILWVCPRSKMSGLYGAGLLLPVLLGMVAEVLYVFGKYRRFKLPSINIASFDVRISFSAAVIAAVKVVPVNSLPVCVS